jgi:peroxiredoxin-like protein
MQEFPHHYTVVASGDGETDVTVESENLPALRTAPPAEFGGPGDRWSPEAFLVAALANCFIFTFRAMARASKLEWTSLRCEAEGLLDRVDRVIRFTEFFLRARLQLPEGVDEDRAHKLLERAERGCLVTNSLTATVHLEAETEVVG